MNSWLKNIPCLLEMERRFANIALDRGLDIFQHYEMNDAFTFANCLQQYRPCKAFEVTFIKTGAGTVLPGGGTY